MSISEASLQGRGLSLWRGDRCLFQNLGFELSNSQWLHVSGGNGSGKTTLLRVLAGLTMPEAGDVFWDDKRISRSRFDYHRSMIYMGHLEGLKGDMNPEENLRFHYQLRDKQAGERIEMAIERLGLQRCRSLPCRSLSAGQRRRAALARVLVSSATLWILDEPFANLDVKGRELVEELVSEHLDQGGMAILAAHHEMKINGGTRVPLELS
jgi:heme exporter protein A